MTIWPASWNAVARRADSRILRPYSSLLALRSSAAIEPGSAGLASASSSKRRMASGRVGRGSGCAAIQASRAAIDSIGT